MSLIAAIRQRVFGRIRVLPADPHELIVPKNYHQIRRECIVPEQKKVFVIKQSKQLSQSSGQTLVIGLMAHMSRIATTILQLKVSKTNIVDNAAMDEDYRQLAINLHRLANDLQTFLNHKSNVSGERQP